MEKPQDRCTASELQGKSPGDVLEELARRGARQLLAQAMEAEVAEHVEKHRNLTDEDDRRLVVRNGDLPERELVTGIGPLRVRQPRIDDARTFSPPGRDSRNTGLRFTPRPSPRLSRQVEGEQLLLVLPQAVYRLGILFLPGVHKMFGGRQITQRAIRRGAFRSVKELVSKIEGYVNNYNRHACPFAWTATADSILEKIKRLSQAISETRH